MAFVNHVYGVGDCNMKVVVRVARQIVLLQVLKFAYSFDVYRRPENLSV